MPQVRVCLAIVGLLLGFAAAPQSQQGPPPPPPPPPGLPVGPPPASGTSFVAGQVLEVNTNQPVAGAAVFGSARGTTPPSLPPRGRAGGSTILPAVLTDAQGRFYFANLPAGTVTVSAEAPGYVASGSATAELSAGERVMNVKLRLAKLASLAGTLRDEAGDPVVGMTVAAIRRAIVNGRPGLQATGATSRSDDRGNFRLANVAPGEYLIYAYGRDPNPFDATLLTTLASEPINLMAVAARALTVGSDVVSIDNTMRTYAPTFYPNSTTVARATRLTVAPGEERTDVHIAVAMVRSARVSGRVIGAQSAVQASALRLVPAADAEAGVEVTRIPAMLVQPDGRFDFANVPPGQYRLTATHRETGATGGSPTGLAMSMVAGRGLLAGMPPPPPPPPPPIRVDQREGVPAPLWADELITVPETGVSGLVITLNQPASVAGRVQYVGAAPPPTQDVIVRASMSLQPISVLTTNTLVLPMTAVNADGSYRIASLLPGTYVVASNLAALSPFRTLRSVMAGGVDITDLPLEVGARNVTDIVVTMTDTPLASLAVTMPDAVRNEETDRYRVLIFPADQKYWAAPAAATRRFRTLTLSTKGTAGATGLPAGDYLVTVATVEEAADWMDAARLEPLSRRAQRLTLADGGQRSLEVRK